MISFKKNFSVYKCKFCNSPCVYVTGALQTSFINTRFWECVNHSHTVKFFILDDVRAKLYPHLQVGDIITHSIELSYKDALYYAEWNVPSKWRQAFHLTKSIISTSRSQGYSQSSTITVFTADAAPSNVTPENIHEKLPIWLMLI